MAEVVNDYGILELTREPFRQANKQLIIGEATYNRVPPLPESTTFDGSWRHIWASSGMTPTSSDSVSSERILTLSSDGRFTHTGSSGYISSFEGADATTGVAGGNTAPLESGTYSAEDYQLLLTGEDGRTETLSLFLPEPDNDDLLVIGGNNYLKED
ncbi:hypothetical protein N8D56_18785 [Devosia sp. A8/3-2]|nr:hypothetical protein N8D56_18785 [Devosia sp. A8/3-2]